MAVPKKRRSKSKRRIKRALWKAAVPNLHKCSNCGSYGLSHHVCMTCGHYKGRQVIKIKVKTPSDKEN